MSDFTIITDSCCDLPAALAEEMKLVVVPLSFILKGHEYKNYLDEREMTFSDFYAAIRLGEQAKTSAVNAEVFERLIEGELLDGRDVICVCFSSALSATYQCAMVAADELRDKYPERKIYIVDSLCESLGQGLLLYLAWQKKLAGASVDEVRDYLEATKHHLCHWFTVDDLNHLRRGGRISRTTAVFGTMLNIKPILHSDTEGRLVNVSKARGRRNSLEALVEHMSETAIDPGAQTVFISHADCIEDAEFTAGLVRERFGVKNIVINSVGPVIGAHCGPGTVALFFRGTVR